MNVGILSNYTNGKLTINENYIRWVRTFARPILINPCLRQLEDCPLVEDVDMLIMPGGSDVNPERYGSPWYDCISEPNRALEFWDKVCLPEYIQQGVPIYGICRGLQSLNVFFGGTLKVHVNEPTSGMDGSPAHLLHIFADNSYVPVSSNHHQSIRKLGHGLQPLAEGIAMNDKGEPLMVKNKEGEKVVKKLEIEAIRHVKYPIVATQFHPEKNYSGEDCEKANNFVMSLIESICPKV